MSLSIRDRTIGGIDILEVGGCTCLRLRKTSRRITQIYERHLQAADLTIGQFGVLAHLFAARPHGLKVGALADLLQVDPTTLKRTLGPLAMASRIATQTDPADRRVRVVTITEAGHAALAAAIPLWQQAQHAMGDILGDEGKHALDHVLDRTLAQLGVERTAPDR